ncbi:MAG: hypothetical protein AAGD25_10175 [Cyanobacteria bacterium P01_F01_bin.150]
MTTLQLNSLAKESQSRNGSAASPGASKNRPTPPIVKVVDAGHGEIKVWDNHGLMIIQNGYVTNPDRGMLRARNAGNHSVVTKDYRRLYGDVACSSSKAILAVNADKAANPVDMLLPTLRPEDDGQDIILGWFHWDEDELAPIQERLLGQHQATVDGHDITVNVTDFYGFAEGMGTWHLINDDLSDGDTLLYVLGFGTTEKRVIRSDGSYFGPDPDRSLTVSDLVKAIASDPFVASKLSNRPDVPPSEALIAAGLRKDSIGSISAEHWAIVKQKYIAPWYEQVQEALISDEYIQRVNNRVLTGGGAALIAPYASEFAVVPTDPGTACVRGAYEHIRSVVGV